MKKINIYIISFLLLPLLNLSCGSSEKEINEINIGNIIWMGQNLNVNKFRNGEPIPEAKTVEEWKLACENEQPAWCHYENDATNGDKYGKLYNWYAVNSKNNIAPEGWHVASKDEWFGLEGSIKGREGTALKSKEGWNTGNGTDLFGFTGLPGGKRDYKGIFSKVGDGGYWWTSSERRGKAYYRYFSSKHGNSERDKGSKWYGRSVRCIKDDLEIAQIGEISTKKISDIEIMNRDLGKRNWSDAVRFCNELGDGWRLPSKDELDILYKNKKEIGGFADNVRNNYWSNTRDQKGRLLWIQNFYNGSVAITPEESKCSIRLVRNK